MAGQDLKPVKNRGPAQPPTYFTEGAVIVQHEKTHDPIIDWPRCLVCNNALSAAFANVADMPLGPRDAGKLITVLRREAERHVSHGAAS